MNANESMVDALQASTPFATLPRELLGRIAALGRCVDHAPDETIYEVGTAAHEIFLILSGEVRHAFDPGLAVASELELVKVIGPGAVFGWAALLRTPDEARPRERFAKVVSIGVTRVLAMNADALFGLLDTAPGAKAEVQHGFAAMVRHLYGFVGLVKMGDKMVPASIASSEPGTTLEYDTFGF